MNCTPMPKKLTYEEYKKVNFDYAWYKRKSNKIKHYHRKYNKQNTILCDNINSISSNYYDNKIFTTHQIIVNIYERKYYQTTVKLFYNSGFSLSTLQPITVLVPVNDTTTIPVTITHYSVPYAEYMSGISGINDNDIVFQSTKYSAQFCVDDSFNNKKQIWNVDIIILDIYSEQPLAYTN